MLDMQVIVRLLVLEVQRRRDYLHIKHWGYPFNRRGAGRWFSTGGLLVGAPGSVGARVSVAAWAALSVVVCWR